MTVGESETRVVTVSNVGTADLTISACDTDGEPFRASFEGSLPIVLEPSEDIQITVFFEPEAADVFDGTLTIESDDPDSHFTDVGLHGQGEAAG